MAGDEWIPWIALETIHLGAEAEVISGTWIGRNAVLKRRIPRGYRHPELERNLSRQRIFAEARILVRLCENGVKSPILLGIDPEEGWIMMSRIEGRILAKVLQEESDYHVEYKLGQAIRRVHSNGISHGDVTTLNAIWSDDEVIMIDYGLGRLVAEMEHFGLDLHSLHECLSAHHVDRPESMRRVLEGYLDDSTSDDFDARAVVDRFEAIRGRVRYHA